jgi:octopine/nopaline transport system substrate-binding protein
MKKGVGLLTLGLIGSKLYQKSTQELIQQSTQQSTQQSNQKSTLQSTQQSTLQSTQQSKQKSLNTNLIIDKKERKIRTFYIATVGNNPPWNNLKTYNELEGAEIDFGNEACKRMNVDCVWIKEEWDTIIPGLLSGKYDVIISDMSITKDREKIINFTKPYMSDSVRFAVLKNNDNLTQTKKINLNTVTTEDTQILKQLDRSMTGKTVCAQDNTTHKDFLENHLSNKSKIKLYKDNDSVNLNLVDGECDAILGDVGSIINLIEINNTQNIKFTGPQFRGGEFGNGIGVGVRKEDVDILSKWNRAIQNMTDDGTIREISKKWFGRDLSI